MSSSEENPFKLTGMGIPLALFVIALFFWNSLFLLPVKLLTVLFHELSHGIMAILTGGKIISIDIGFNQGGLCRSMGGWPIFIASAGYLGSLIWGSVILLTSLRKGANKKITIGLGFILLLVTLLWVRGLETLLITLSTAAALIFIGTKLKEEYCSIIVKFISLISCFYVVFDIKDDLLDRTVNGSDAYQISKMIFPFSPSIGSYIIGLLWMAVAVFILWKVFKAAFK